MVWGPLLTFAANVAGGFLSSSSEKKRDKANREAAAAANARNEKRVTDMNADVRRRAESAAAVPIVTNTQNWVDVDAMMAGAEAAGFNPVTWLRNGGMQAYSQSSTQVWNSQLMDAALAGSSIFQEGMPPLETARGAGEVIGSALTAGASQWVLEAQQERQNQFQLQLMDMQLQGANRNGTGNGYSGYVPTSFLGGSHKTGKGSAALGGGADSAYKWVTMADGTRVKVPDPEVMPDAELAISGALYPWIRAEDQGKPSTAFQHAGDYIIHDWNKFWKSAPQPQGPNAPPPWWSLEYWQ